MKPVLRQMFKPILSIFEEQEGAFAYKPSHRLILKVVGTLFFILSLASLAGWIVSGQSGAIIPVVIFFVIGLVCMVVGFLGTDKGVAKIWNSRS